ncbi:unnamed protein product [Closterium sp. NIES-54]
MMLAPEGDPDALDIAIPRNHAEAVSGPWTSGMWLYKVKRPPGAPPVFKARYVVRGFSQREGVDFFQTFAPTPKMTTLRVLLHIAAQRDYELHSLDFSTAFLQGSLHEQIWLRRPPGFTGSFPPGTQWQLRRLVYGLRQAPREWHGTLRTTLAALDFFLSSADPSLFVRRGSTPFFVLVYVDDLRYLGLQITRDRAARTIMLTQSHMVEQILTRFHLPFSKVQPTPLAMDYGLTAPPSDEPFESSGPYPKLIYHYFDGSYAKAVEDTEDAHAQYYSESLMAYSVLLRNMTPAEQLGIRSYKESAAPALEAWKHLVEVYQPKDSVTASRLLQQLMETKMGHGEKANTYINRCRNVPDQITKHGSATSEEIFVDIVLQGLGLEWSPAKHYSDNKGSSPKPRYAPPS